MDFSKLAYLNNAHFDDDEQYIFREDLFVFKNPQKIASFGSLDRGTVEKVYPKWFKWAWKVLNLDAVSEDIFSLDEKSEMAQDLTINWFVYYDRDGKECPSFPVLAWFWSWSTWDRLETIRRYSEKKYGKGTIKSEIVASSILSYSQEKYRKQVEKMEKLANR